MPCYYMIYHNFDRKKRSPNMIRTLVSFRIGAVIQAYGNVTLYLMQSTCTLLPGLMNFCVNL